VPSFTATNADDCNNSLAFFGVADGPMHSSALIEPICGASAYGKHG
jgi:hypothetical protein